eukprot:3608190-Rhodomonas_salina.5
MPLLPRAVTDRTSQHRRALLKFSTATMPGMRLVAMKSMTPAPTPSKMPMLWSTSTVISSMPRSTNAPKMAESDDMKLRHRAICQELPPSAARHNTTVTTTARRSSASHSWARTELSGGGKGTHKPLSTRMMKSDSSCGI